MASLGSGVGLVTFIYDVQVREVVWMFNETTQSFFVWGSSWASAAPQCCCPC